MSEMGPKAQAERDKFEAELYRMLLEEMRAGPIPISEDGSKAVVEVALAAYRRVFPDYIITVDPPTEEDRLERSSPKIRIEFPKQISTSVTVEK